MGWDEDLSEDLRADILDAINRYKFTSASRAKLKRTLAALDKMSRYMPPSVFNERKEGLSEIAKAAMYQNGLKLKPQADTGRYALSKAQHWTEEIGEAAENAREQLINMIAPNSTKGQGANSVLGRALEHQVMAADYRWATHRGANYPAGAANASFPELDPLTEAKDKLGIEVLWALASHGHSLMTGSLRERPLGIFLNSVWRSVHPRRKPPNWSNVLRERKTVASIQRGLADAQIFPNEFS